MNTNFKKYVIFWLSGSVSQLGSAMTSFALILWVYTKNNSAMIVSMMSFFNYLPYIVVSIFAGSFVDRHSKKKIMLAADTVAAMCSLIVLFLCNAGRLTMLYIYFVNFVIGFMNAFQSPAQSVVTGLLVPKAYLVKASGMDSFSANMVQVLSPVFASFLFGVGGLELVITADMFSFALNFIVLLCFIDMPEKLTDSESKNRNKSKSENKSEDKGKTKSKNKSKNKNESILSGCEAGFLFIQKNKGLLYIMVTMAVLNFLSRLTYENILSPMILARSGHNAQVLSIVHAVLGIGGILGGVIVSTDRLKISHVKKIYYSAAFSFLCGDLLMGLGNNGFWWSVAAAAASLPIPLILAGQQVIMYETVPRALWGSVFSVRNVVQFCTIPAGILLGGVLADYVFEPLMQSDAYIARILGRIVGNGAGSGMAVMFLCTGVLGAIFSCVAYHNKEIQKIK